MAAAALAITIRSIHSERGSGRVRVFGTVAIGASPGTYITGGFPFGLAQIGPIADSAGNMIQTLSEAKWIKFSGLQGKFLYYWDRVNVAMRIFIVSTQAEIANGVAIDAAISGDTIDFEADFQYGV